MQKKHLLRVGIFIMMVASTQNGIAQGMAVNATGTAADASAALDVSSTSQGILVPRMTVVQRNAIGTPVNGLLIYQTDVTPGFYFYNGSAWTAVSGGAPSGTAGGNLGGTYPNPSVASLPAISGASLTNLSGGNITAGTVTMTKLSATGTADNTTYLRGDGAWATPAGGGSTASGITVYTTPGGTANHSITISDLSMRYFVFDVQMAAFSLTTMNVTLPSPASYAAGTILRFGYQHYNSSVGGEIALRCTTPAGTTIDPGIGASGTTSIKLASVTATLYSNGSTKWIEIPSL